MNKTIKIILGVLFAGAVVFPCLIFGKIGVGVGVGKIQLNEKLKPGAFYTLPSLPVLNTGDVPTEYEVSVEYHEGQETKAEMGLRPAREWFSFEPKNFHLEPGEMQEVGIKLTLPIKGVKPGNYFAYLEAHPLSKTEKGQTSVGVAAAAKLYFTIAPANILQGIYYRFISIYLRYHPWDTIFLVALVVFFVIALFNKKFKIQIIKK